MNLVFLSSSTGWGGLEQNLLRYSNWMREAGNAVTILAVAQSPLYNQAVAFDLPVVVIKRQKRHFPWRAAFRLKRLLTLLDTDVVWMRDPRDLPLAAFAVNKMKCRLVFQQGMQINRPKKYPWHRWRFAQIEQWVTPLAILEKEALKNTPLTPRQITHIPLALEPDWFSRSISKNDARNECAVPLDALVVGLFGRLDPLKGQDVLLKALVDATEWHALIVGSNTANAENDWEKKLLNQAKQLGVDHRIHWRGQMNSLKNAYAACDVYAMCSQSETFGMVTLEALASGIPVIGTNSGGTPELLQEGACGHLVPPGDAHALAEALNQYKKIPIPSVQSLISFQKKSSVESWLKLLDAPPRRAS